MAIINPTMTKMRQAMNGRTIGCIQLRLDFWAKTDIITGPELLDESVYYWIQDFRDTLLLLQRSSLPYLERLFLDMDLGLGKPLMRRLPAEQLRPYPKHAKMLAAWHAHPDQMQDFFGQEFMRAFWGYSALQQTNEHTFQRLHQLSVVCGQWQTVNAFVPFDVFTRLTTFLWESVSAKSVITMPELQTLALDLNLLEWQQKQTDFAMLCPRLESLVLRMQTYTNPSRQSPAIFTWPRTLRLLDVRLNHVEPQLQLQAIPEEVITVVLQGVSWDLAAGAMKHVLAQQSLLYLDVMAIAPRNTMLPLELITVNGTDLTAEQLPVPDELRAPLWSHADFTGQRNDQRYSLDPDQVNQIIQSLIALTRFDGHIVRLGAAGTLAWDVPGAGSYTWQLEPLANGGLAAVGTSGLIRLAANGKTLVRLPGKGQRLAGDVLPDGSRLALGGTRFSG